MLAACLWAVAKASSKHKWNSISITCVLCLYLNRTRSDNSILNLIKSSPQANSKNRKKPSHNTSGIVGVYFNSRTGKWKAAIGVNRKLIHLGEFINKEDAIAARRTAELIYGFHENHGE